MSNGSLPEWLSALDALLVRLDEFGKPGTLAWQVKAFTVSKLQKAFARAGCAALARWLVGAGPPTLAEITPEVEEAALNCIINALAVPNYGHSLEDENQVAELNELHRRAIRAAKDRLGELKAEATPSGPFADLLTFAKSALKGIERHVIELVCSKGGNYPLADMAADPAICWNSPYDNAWKNTASRINRKLQKIRLPWRLRRRNNQAELVNIPFQNRPKKA